MHQHHSENEAVAILEEVYSSWTGTDEEWELLLKRYFLACTKEIWKLLPREDSRNGIEATEKYMAGLISFEEFHAAEYLSEGAAFCIDYDSDKDSRTVWVKELKRIPEEELRKLVHPLMQLRNLNLRRYY